MQPDPVQPGSARHTSGSLPPALIGLMAVASGSAVANLYYAQPLLHEIGRSFGAGTAATSAVVTCSQVGYAAGLLLIVPLGDLHPRRRLATSVFCAAALAMTVCALSPTLWLFDAASVAAGCASVAGQVLIPFAADLAPAARRGRVVARIMTGLLLGILLARTVAGAVAQIAGWRAIYWFSTALMLLLALVLSRTLPGEQQRPALRYGRLVSSSLRMLAEQPILRRRAWHGACVFGAFSVLWTTLAFLLSGAPYHYSNIVTGLFGLAGVGGVLTANVAGRLADTARSGVATAVAALLVTGSFALLAAGRTLLVPLLVGIVVLDAGTQGMQITNQAIIYALAPEARSRINSAYMVCYFIGGAVGSITAGVVLSADGWHWACALGALFGVGSLAALALERVRAFQRDRTGTLAEAACAGDPPVPGRAVSEGPVAPRARP